MAHVAKRPRLHGPKNPALTLASTSSLNESTRQVATSTPKLRNLQLEHENSLRQNAQRLKSSWEDICRRYGRDFGAEGDEIDLETGQVVVDNGHLRNLSENQHDTWAFNDDDDEEVGDAGSATSSLEMEILGMRPMLGRNEMGGPMLRDDEAGEIDVDEVEVDRDAIDDLFDELEELTMTASVTAKVEEKKRRDKDQKIVQEIEIAPQTASQKDQIGQDSMPSPAFSEPTEEEASQIKSAMQEMEQDNVMVPSPDELPPDDVILEKFGSKWGPAVLALVRTLAEQSKPVELEDPVFATQLTPVSECGRPLAELLADEAEKLMAERERAMVLVTPGASSDAGGNEELVLEEQEELVLEEQEEQAEKEMEPRLEEAIEKTGPFDEPTEALLDCLAVVIEAVSEEEAEAPGVVQKELLMESPIEAPQELVVLENMTESTTAEPDLESPQQHHSNQKSSEELPIVQLQEPEDREPDRTTEMQAAPTEEKLDYLYGDIDDLSTIIIPRALVPVTPKNRIRSVKSKSAIAKKPASTGRRGRPKRRLSEIEIPKQRSSVSRRKSPQTAPSKPRQPVFTPSSKESPQDTNASQKPRNFWSALPDDPFYDPMWQDDHPDGEPAFEEFERRRALLEEHKVKAKEQELSLDDDLMVLTSSPVAAKKIPKPKAHQTPKPTVKNTPKTKEKGTPKSTKRIKKEQDVFEKKLHTPRSGKFLEYLQKRLIGEKDTVKAEASEDATLCISTADAAEVKPEDEATNTPETPMRKIKNEYGLSDSEDELAREVWFVKDKDVEIVGTRKKKRTRGRPPKQMEKAPKESAPPLVVPEVPPQSSPSKGTGIKTEEDEKFGPSNKCIEDWNT
ncbi:hypothetical protein ABW20_dc0103596 [Dactylellina cionopaga]|nr:hypothetical protein ABW20_dc0103596 [Dactylellina cionopaga]